MNIRTVGVVGAGQMGAGIAHVASAAGFDVVLTDIDSAVVERALETIDHNLDRQIKKGTVTTSQKSEALNRITGSTHLDEHRRADLVIESAEESYPIKAEIFRQLDALCADPTVLASNTS
jgi:3-hydroxybutyryl-CoA dehydrogenase